LAAGLAGCGPGGEVRLVGEEIAQASSGRSVLQPAAPTVADLGQPAPQPVAPAAPAPAVDLQPSPVPTPYSAFVESPPVPVYATAAEPMPTSQPALAGWPFFSGLMAPTETLVVPTMEPTWTPFPTATLPPTPTPDPLVNAGQPVQIEIPAIGVTALVEQVGLTRDGAMDTPKGWMNAAWFSQGFRPGEAGNSVIAGHLDSRSGGPAVFWGLSRLQPGDEVTVTYENGDRYTFGVQDIETVPYDIEGEAVAAIFGPSQTSDLNLITCNGQWDRGKATYTQRLVVYTSLIPEKTVRGGFTGSYD
jgi:sortase (surface protein transpeptidase)